MDTITQKGWTTGWIRIQKLENMAKFFTWSPPHSPGWDAERTRRTRKS